MRRRKVSCAVETFAITAVALILSASVIAAQCVLTCTANITSSTDTDACSADLMYDFPDTSGDCSTQSCDPPQGQFPVGTTTVTCTDDDTNATCQFTITVNDTQSPTITCPMNVTGGTDPDVCTAVREFSAPGLDNCPNVQVMCTPTSGSSFPLGTTTVTCTATDASGNNASCAFTETVNDTQAPTVKCSGNITQSNDPGLCSAAVTFAAPTAADNCPGVGTAMCDHTSGASVPVGTTTVTCSATDAAGLMGMCSFTETVQDTEPPTIDAGPDQRRLLIDSKPVEVVFPPPTFGDNCPGATAACLPPSGSLFPGGVTTVTCTATDKAGNSASDTLLVIIAHAVPVLGTGMLVLLCAGLAAMAVRRLRARS